MKKAMVYIHGKGGSAEEAKHYEMLFPEYDVIGFDYRSQTPWEAREEFTAYFGRLREHYAAVSIAANSLGAYFALHGLYQFDIERAFFISPIVDMEKLIYEMFKWAGVTERELKERGTIETDFDETLSWEYLSWVRNHPVSWSVPTALLYGTEDTLQSIGIMRSFSKKTGAVLTVMEGGEHWFHTEEQMAFLDDWIRRTLEEELIRQ